MTVKVCDICGKKATAAEGSGSIILENPKPREGERKHCSSYLYITAAYNIDGVSIDLCRKCRLDIFKQAVKALTTELSNYQEA